jgi:hypothetical protein
VRRDGISEAGHATGARKVRHGRSHRWYRIALGAIGGEITSEITIGRHATAAAAAATTTEASGGHGRTIEAALAACMHQFCEGMAGGRWRMAGG